MSQYFQQEKPQVWRAGGIPYVIDDDGTIEMMFMIPATTDYNQQYPDLKLPQIAKGRVERFEQPYPAALRECAEELGLVESNIVNVIDGGVVLGRTNVYAIQVADKARFDRYSNETESTMWMTYDEFMQSGRELHKVVVEMLYNRIVEQYFSEMA